MDWVCRRADSRGWAETDPTGNSQVRRMMARGACRNASTAGHGMPTTEAPKNALRGRESHQVQAKQVTLGTDRDRRGTQATRGGERTPSKSGGGPEWGDAVGATITQLVPHQFTKGNACGPMTAASAPKCGWGSQPPGPRWRR
jgi:hypothetical protein